MYCSLEFSPLGLLVAAHSLWNEEQTHCVLRIFTNLEQAQAAVAEVSDEARQDFERCMCALPQHRDESSMIEIKGDPALSLTSALVTLRHKIQVLPRISNKPELMGFWNPPGPPIRQKPSRGTLMWFHPHDGYHVVIPHSKEQAEQVIRGLSSWLGRERKGRLVSQIKRWNSPDESSWVPQEIEGIVAEVICKSSIALKVSQAMEKQAKAKWN